MYIFEAISANFMKCWSWARTGLACLRHSIFPYNLKKYVHYQDRISDERWSQKATRHPVLLKDKLKEAEFEPLILKDLLLNILIMLR